MNRALRLRLRPWLAFGLTLLAGLLQVGVAAAAPAAQVPPGSPGPLAPPIVFILLLALIFVAVLAFSFIAYRNAQR